MNGVGKGGMGGGGQFVVLKIPFFIIEVHMLYFKYSCTQIQDRGQNLHEHLTIYFGGKINS